MNATISFSRPPLSGPVRLAIIGTGAIAKTHAIAAALVPEARLTAVWGRDLRKAQEFAAPFGIRATDSLETIARADDIHAVLIATASGAHAEGALPLMRAGKHVLCEKPLEINLGRAQPMIEAAQQSNVLLAGFFPLRQGEAARRIKEAVVGNRFGRLTFLSARVKWWREPSYYQSSSWRGRQRWEGGGALINQGIHAVDLLQWFGGKLVEVSAYAGTLAHSGIEVEDTLSASLRFENGALGTIAASTSCYPGLNLNVEISGDRGTAVLENDRITFWKFSEERPEDEIIRANKHAGQAIGGASDPLVMSCEGHRQQIAAFCRVLLGGQEEIIRGEDAAVALSIVDAIYLSSKTGKSEKPA